MRAKRTSAAASAPRERGPHDRVETDDEAQQGMTLLQMQFRRMEKLAERAERLAVADGSSLDADQAAAPYRSGPDIVRAAVSTALDHLHGVLLSVEKSDGHILAMALFTLIRSAYEAAGTGIWILRPASRDERILRALRLTRGDRRQVRSVSRTLGRDDEGFARVEKRLIVIRDARPKIAGVSIAEVASMTKRLEEVGDDFQDLWLPPLALWQMASGIAHANSSMMMTLLERQQAGPNTKGGADFKLTSSVRAIAGFYAAALDMVEALLNLWDQRNQEVKVNGYASPIRPDDGRFRAGSENRDTPVPKPVTKT